MQPDADLQQRFLASAQDINLVNNTVRLPLHQGMLPNGTTVYFIVTEASTEAAAKAWGVSYAPVLADVKGTSVVQKALSVVSANDTTANPRRSLLAPATDSVARSNASPYQVIEVPATVNFQHGKRSITPNPQTGFPPLNFSYSAQGDPGGANT
jgi:hypothetical protein